ncbi:MAG TPA: ABC transporter permease [Bryobacteraceae bacterium]|nr:ABC transporter permease [Bryobacteraceae bacterium]
MSDTTFLESVSRDVTYALRTMRKNPAFAVVAVVTLALSIGANTASFSVIRAVLLKPLEYRDPDQLMSISGGATPARFAEMETTARSFTGIGAFTSQENLTLAGGVQPEVLKAARVSAGFLTILGAMPVLGRGFLPREDSPGGIAAAMISAELWQRLFNGDLHIAGRTMNLAGAQYTIIGVLPVRFQFPSPGLDVWLTQPSEWPAVPPKSRSLSPFLSVFGRLKPGLTIERANAEMALIQHQYAMSHPAMLDAKPKSPVSVKPLKEQVVGNIRSELWMLFGAVAFVLLIACANIASLLLARANVRSREFAVRSALGATRSQLITQLLIESVLLSSLGGACGMLFAVWSLRAIRHFPAFNLPRADEIHLDGMVLAFAATLSFVTGILFGLAPSLTASRPDLIGVLRARTGDLNRGIPGRFQTRFSVRSILVIGQVALSIVLLIGAALLTESVIHLQSDSPGFDSTHLLTMRISLPPPRYDTDQKKNTFFEELIRRVGAQPGVHSAAAAMTLPMTGFAGTPVQDAGKPPLPLNGRPIATILITTPEYFQTLKIPVRRGRTFTDRDREGAQRVAVIDEGLARRFWPTYPSGQNPIGQHLLIGGTNPQPAEVIGVVGNVHQSIDNSGWPESVYVSFAQNPLPSAMLVMRTEGDPLALTSTIRQQMQALDRDQPISDVQSMEDLVEAQLGQRRLLVMLLGLFAGVAVILALVGVYGVIAYSVTQRIPEMGIRRALGAREGDILWLIVGEAFGLALAGAVIGLGGALALTRVLKTLLFHVSPADPATFVTVALLFVLVALGASYLPARRAARTDPMVALRYE